MAKKKKPAIKGNVNRGFATTSTPSKKIDQATAAPSHSDTVGSSTESSTKPDGGALTNTRDPSKAGTNGTNVNELQGAERLQMQELIDKLSARAKKEISRLWKVRPSLPLTRVLSC